MLKKLEPLGDQSVKRGVNKFFTWDIESREWIYPLMVGCYDGTTYKYFTDIGLFLDFCFKRFPDWDGFAHFGGKFDFLFILQEILKNHEDIEIKDMVPRGSGLLYLEFVKDGRKIIFRDSSALLPFGLARITKNFGVDHVKQSFDVSRVERVSKRLIEYNKYDVIGLHESIQKFYQQPLIRRAGPAYTIASQSMRVLRTYLKKPISHLNDRLDRKIRRAYLGGRVEIFKPFYESETKPIYGYDVNSLYPYVMQQNEYPDKFDYQTSTYEKAKHGFYECKVSVPKKMHVPPLGIVHEGKYIFPTGNFRGLYTTHEINYARSLGVRITTGKGFVFSNGGFIFRDFINDLYRIRKASVKDSVDDTVAKLLMNSCYGRFGLRLKRENIVFDDGSLGLRPLRELKVGRHTYRLMTKDIELESFNNVAIAAYVTAFARIHMHRIYQKCGAKLFYTDTDSIYTTKKFPVSDKLGALKEVSVDYSACYLLPKTYIVGKKIVMKGFDAKKIQHFTLDDFYTALEGDLKHMRITEEPKFCTLKRAMRTGEILTLTKGSSRQLRSFYDKRIIIKKGKPNDWTTKAITL